LGFFYCERSTKLEAPHPQTEDSSVTPAVALYRLAGERQ
jgi:hypothetical protein